MEHGYSWAYICKIHELKNVVGLCKLGGDGGGVWKHELGCKGRKVDVGGLGIPLPPFISQACHNVGDSFNILK